MSSDAKVTNSCRESPKDTARSFARIAGSGAITRIALRARYRRAPGRSLTRGLASSSSCPSVVRQRTGEGAKERESVRPGTLSIPRIRVDLCCSVLGSAGFPNRLSEVRILPRAPKAGVAAPPPDPCSTSDLTRTPDIHQPPNCIPTGSIAKSSCPCRPRRCGTESTATTACRDSSGRFADRRPWEFSLTCPPSRTTPGSVTCPDSRSLGTSRRGRTSNRTLLLERPRR